MTYSEWTTRGKEICGTAGKAAAMLGITTAAVYKSAGSESAGQVHAKYEYMLLGLELTQSKFLQQCKRHEKSPLLSAVLDDLDSR